MRNPTASRKTASKKHVPPYCRSGPDFRTEHPLFNQAPGSSSPGPFHPSPPVMSSDISTNKKARRDYEILDTYECGMELKGTEVKSIRAGKVNIADSFARVENGQMLLYGCDIQPWETAGEFFQHQSRRPRRLLLHKREIFKLEQQTSQKGCSLVALKLYWKNGKVKLALGLGKGKTHRDQRYDLKARVEMREAQREVARINRR
ncbi:SsrA-binding protein SmpB [Akkermansia massiliensis]|nr:SsrA-binding protein SmpB [Akkermansia massiliensis]